MILNELSHITTVPGNWGGPGLTLDIMNTDLTSNEATTGS